MATRPNRLYQLWVYVPSSHVDVLKEALFMAGAGRLGAYDCCCWQTEGVGQFRPRPGSTPYLGTEDSVEVVPETKLELVVRGECLQTALEALARAHPYETPAFSYWRINAS